MVHSSEEGKAEGAGGSPLDFAYSQEAERTEYWSLSFLSFFFKFNLGPHSPLHMHT